EETHGAALGEDEVAATRQALGWEYEPFEIPDAIRQGWDARSAGQAAEEEWQARFEAYRKDHPELAAEFERRMKQEVPADFDASMDAIIKEYRDGQKADATRKHSGAMLNTIVEKVPEVLGGSADLAPSNNTKWKEAPIITPAKEQKGEHGRYLHYGVREFGMAAIMNGISLHRGYRPYGGTFLIFSDYMRNGLRMSALMHQPVTYVFTHDSIGLGEDGPTHQPIEQLASLRAMPGMTVYRPADGVETAVGWKIALSATEGPVSLVLTRQKTPGLDHTDETVAGAAKGGYVLKDADGEPEGIILASGSEVALALKAREQLASQGKQVRVVSMPSWELFEAQDAAYKKSVLPDSVTKRVAVEAAETMGWERYVGRDGATVGIHQFGESAPGDTLFEKFGFVPETVVKAYNDLG
ncbi:MAG: transketolase C-terminal domain-containing protein, partial [Thiohalorhabdaceae bacterium]